MLRISEKAFNRLYPDLEGHYNFFSDPVPADISKEDFERTYLPSKLWRLNNLYTVVDKHGNAVRFVMNEAQHIVYAMTRQHPRVIILKSRQQGISTFWLVSYFDDGLFQELLAIGLMAQGVDEASTLLERAKFLWDKLDSDIKAFLGRSLEKDNAKAFTFNNHSQIFIRVSFRSTTLQRLHISEFGKIANHSPKKAKEVKTGTLQALAAGNTGVIESTAEGRNMFKEMWDASVTALASGQIAPKDFYPVFLSWLDDPDCVSPVFQSESAEQSKYFASIEAKVGRQLTQEQKNFWIIQYRELGGDIHQEYPATPEEAFTAAKDGTYYSRLYMEKVIRGGNMVSDLYDPNLPLDVYLDLGVDDYFVVGFVQWYDGKYRIVDEYWNNGYSIQHYLEEVKSRYDGAVRTICGPHDLAVRELGQMGSGGRAKSREDIVREWLRANMPGTTLKVLPKTSIADGIAAVRRMIPNMMIDTKCNYIHECCLNYSKEWDDKLQVWKLTPLHDEFSHGADMLRLVAANTIENSDYNRSSLEQTYKSKTKGYAI